jgi:hypothetical protein
MEKSQRGKKLVMLTKTKKFDDDILAIIRGMEWSPDGKLGKLVCGQIDKSTYARLNVALEIMGGKWNRKLGGHSFSTDPRLSIEGLLESGTLSVDKDEFFETPDWVADKMISDIGLPENCWALEPSAGLGAIVRRMIAAQPHVKLFCVEQNAERCAELLKIPNISVCCDDFSHADTAVLYDRVVMNPPFKFEIEHIYKAYHWLKPGGKLASVCSEAVFQREDEPSRGFQRSVEAHGRSVKLPTNTFRHKGTSVDTRLVYLEKK